jgi:hypothetical protein
MTTVDLTPIVTTLLGIVSVAITTAIPILVTAVLKRLGVANDADLRQSLTAELQAGAGAAYKYATEHEGGLANVAVHNAAIVEGVNHVTAIMPDIITKLGLSDADVQNMVTAQLGKLLASDPTITAGRPPNVQAPAHAPVPAPAPAEAAHA